MQQHLRSDEVDYCYDATLENMDEHVSWEDTFFDGSEEEDHDACSLRADASALEGEYYYDEHPLLEDVMTEGPLHAELVEYLKAVLRWLSEGKRSALHANLGISHSQDGELPSLAPDLCVFRGIAPDSSTFRSWKIGQTGPAPHVVFEIASQGTWKKDVQEKPQLYARMGVKEYFLYDPHTPPLMKGKRRLRGWKLSRDGEMKALVRHKAGWLWSQQLESYLAADGTLLRLYDNQGQLRLTEAEARKRNEQELTQEKLLAEQRARTSNQEKLLAEQRARTSNQEKLLAEQRAQTLAQEKQRAEQDKHLAEQRAQTSEQQAHTLAQEKRLAEQRAHASEQQAHTLAQEKQQAEQDKHLAEQRAQTLAQDKRLAEQRAHALAEQLRALGINPDDLA